MKLLTLHILDAAVIEGRISLDDLRGERRWKRFVTVRWAIALICRQQGYSFPRIGRALNRDHSTMVHAVTGADNRLKSDLMFEALVNRIRNRAESLQTACSTRAIAA